MKVLLLSDADSIHTLRWVRSLSQRGCEILLFNLLRCDLSPYDGMPNVKVYSCDFVLRDSAAISQRILDKIVYQFRPHRCSVRLPPLCAVGVG